MNIIFEGIHGSRLFELNNELSDTDIKAIYIPELLDVVNGKFKKTITYNDKEFHNEKSDSKTIDKEVMSIQFFIEKALEGLIIQVDMLFSPEDKTIVTSDLWKFIVANKNKIVSKTMIPAFRGYVYQQIGKYAKRVKKVSQAEEIVDILNKYNDDTVFEHIFEENKAFFEDNPNITLDVHQNIRCFNFMGKMYIFTTKNYHILDSLNKYIGKYGSRVLELKKNENVDWKSISHAFRGIYQLKRLALYGEYQHPIPEKDYILQIKNGELDYELLMDELYEEIENTLMLAENSTMIPDEPDYEFWNNFILDVYVNQIKEKY
jgi:hypothetical protein